MYICTYINQDKYIQIYCITIHLIKNIYKLLEMSKVTLAEIKERLGISRTTFNEKYKDYVIQLPSITNVNLYDWNSVLDWHTKRPKAKRGRKPKQETLK